MTSKFDKTLLIVKVVSLSALALLLGTLGIMSLTEPARQQKKMDAQSDILLTSIEQGDGRIQIASALKESSVDFYQEPDEVDLIPVAQAVTQSAESNPVITVDNEVRGLGILEISAIDLKMPVVYGAGSSQLKIAAGWVPQTARIGSVGNAVIAGHRNYTRGSHFNRLGEIVVGDSIHYTSADNESMSFVVTEILETLPSDPVAFEQPTNTQMITLYTCTPVRTATHRLLVRAVRVS